MTQPLSAEAASGADREIVMYYEELRGGIVQPNGPGGRGLGWALFVRKGMAAWLDAWRKNVWRQIPDPVPPRVKFSLADQGQQDEIVVIWTGMVLSHVVEGIG